MLRGALPVYAHAVVENTSLRAGNEDHLTPRELQVLEMVASGATNARTAESLGVTVHAVKFHLASAYKKLGVTNRTEAAVIFIRHQEADA